MNIQTTYVLAYGKAVAMPSNWLRCVLLVELGFGSIILVNTELPICMYLLYICIYVSTSSLQLNNILGLVVMIFLHFVNL